MRVSIFVDVCHRVDSCTLFPVEGFESSPRVGCSTGKLATTEGLDIISPVSLRPLQKRVLAAHFKRAGIVRPYNTFHRKKHSETLWEIWRRKFEPLGHRGRHRLSLAVLSSETKAVSCRRKYSGGHCWSYLQMDRGWGSVSIIQELSY